MYCDTSLPGDWIAHSQVETTKQKTLPDGWRWARLGDVCAITETRDPRRTPDEAFTYVDISSVDNINKRIIEARKIGGKDAPSRARQVIHSGDVIVSTTRPNLNAVALVPSELNDQICSTGFCVLRPKDALDSLFLFAFVQTPGFVNELSESVKGALYPAVTDAQVRALHMPLPPLREQQRIAARLNDIMAEIARARDAAQAALNAANVIPTAFLNALFTSDEIQQAPLRRLDQIAKRISKGESPAWQGFSYVDKGTRFIRSENVLWGTFSDEPRVYIPLQFHEKLARCQLRAGDVLINLVGASIGRSCIVPDSLGEANVNQAVGVVTPSDSLIAEYLVAFIISPLTRKHFEEVQVEMARPNISLENLRELEIPLPTRETQERITAEFSTKMNLAREVRIAAKMQFDAIKALPAMFLRRAFNGEL